MPPDFVFVNRIQWGVYSILARLGATANWHRIHREYLYGDAPSTALGELEREHRAAWCRARGLDAHAAFGVDGDGKVRLRETAPAAAPPAPSAARRG